MQNLADYAVVLFVNALITVIVVGVFWFSSKKTPPPPAIVVPDSTAIHQEINDLRNALAESTAAATSAQQNAEAMNNMVVKLVGKNQQLERRQDETQKQLRETQAELAQVKRVNSELLESNKNLVVERDTMSTQIRKLHQELAQMTLEFREMKGKKARDKNGKLHSSAVTVLREQMTEYFNETELKNLIVDMGMSYEEIPGQTFLDKVRELIAYANRHKRVDDLLSLLNTNRPDVSWVGNE